MAAEIADFNAPPIARRLPCNEDDEDDEYDEDEEEDEVVRPSSRRERLTFIASKQNHQTHPDRTFAKVANIAGCNARPMARGARRRNVAESEEQDEDDDEVVHPSARRARRPKAVQEELKNIEMDEDEDDLMHPSARRARRHQAVQHGRVTKAKHNAQRPSAKGKRMPKKSSKSSRKQNSRDRELKALVWWMYWQSEPEDSSTESDDERHAIPRRHSRDYPPRRVGVQNVPWSKVPPEIRNTIYQHCMEGEAKKTLTVAHYPDGIPRRSIRGVDSATKFAHSYWGFTQSFRQARKELTPWLLTKRKVRTPLATLNTYVNLFHRRGSVDRKRIGNIEPKCTGAPLPSEGVEVLELLKDVHSTSDLHLQLSPRTLFPIIDDNQIGPETEQHDDLALIRRIGALYTAREQSIVDEASITAIRLSSVPRDTQDEADSGDGNGTEDSHDTLITLDIRENKESDHKEQLRRINCFLFHADMHKEPGLVIQA